MINWLIKEIEEIGKSSLAEATWNGTGNSLLTYVGVPYSKVVCNSEDVGYFFDKLTDMETLVAACSVGVMRTAYEIGKSKKEGWKPIIKKGL